ncbi:MAG: helix-turn-helix transcriptional regulator [Rhodoglobus sp.]
MSENTRTNHTLAEWEQDIGNAFRQLRLEAGYAQAELAERANLSRSSVQALEQGAGSRLTTVLAILRALGRIDAFDSIMPDYGPSPLEALAEAQRQATPRRSRKKGS